MRKIMLLPVLLVTIFLQAQTSNADCACCTETYNQFDFWIGDWVVFDTTGKEVGKNNIVKIQDNCVMQESWVSKTMTGTSYNYYNFVDSTWNQLWVDNQGSSLVLKGQLIDGKMVLKSELLKGQRVDLYYNKITWEKNADASVTQTWEILDPDGNLLALAFRGIYKRVDED